VYASPCRSHVEADLASLSLIGRIARSGTLELVRIVYQTKHPGVGAQVKLVGGMGGDLALISSCPGLEDGQNPRAAAAKKFVRLQESI
jgi:hypothetical protein